MATTNLQTQSLGNILVESGDGTPNHTSPKGSYYTNITTGSIFINNTGDSTGWEMLNKVAWGEMYIQSNTTNTTTTLNWVSTTGLTGWVYAGGNGTEMVNTGKLRIRPNKGGIYYLLATGTIQVQNVASTYTAFFGVSKNGATPANGFFTGCMLDGGLTATAAEEDDKTLTVTNIVSLSAGDTLEVSLRASSATPLTRLEAANIFIYRIGD